MEHYRRDLPDLADALGLDIITLPGAFPEKGEIVTPLEKIGENEYRNEDGDIHRVSGSCWLLPYKKNRAAYIPPTIESIQADIEEPEAEPPEDVSSSMQEVHRYAVEHTRSTHFMAALGAVTG